VALSPQQIAAIKRAIKAQQEDAQRMKSFAAPRRR